MTATTLGPAIVIEAPPLAPPKYSLLSANPVVEPEDDRWLNGLQLRPENNQDARSFDLCSDSDVVTTFSADTISGDDGLTSATANFALTDVGKIVTGTGIPAGTSITTVTDATTVVLSAEATATGTATMTIVDRGPAPNSLPYRTVFPFGVEAYDTCSAFGFSKADYEGRARRALISREPKAIEAELWTGTRISDNVHLQSSDTIQLEGGAAQSIRDGLAALVQAVFDNNLGTGMIHARPKLVELWSALNIVMSAANGKLYTLSGVQVVPQAGATGAAPDGTAPTTTSEWAYVTDPVQVWRQPDPEVWVPEADYAQNMDRSVNEITVRAQRGYALVFNGSAVAGVQIDPTVGDTING